MKNKAVEAMIRIQFLIPNDIDVYVDCTHSKTTGLSTIYHFEITWIMFDIKHTVSTNINGVIDETEDLLSVD